MISHNIFRQACRFGSNGYTYLSVGLLYTTPSKVCLLKVVNALRSYSHDTWTSKDPYCLKEVLQQWTRNFQLHKISEPKASAEIIIAHVLGHKTLYCMDKTHTILTSSEASEVSRLCQLRLTRLPVQYIIGEWDFHDLTLKMRSPVLIPRPETEELASLCANTVTQGKDNEAWNVLEIGPGTGAVSIFLLRAFKEMQVVAVDISPHACKLTSENADLVGVSDRLRVIEGDFSHGVVQQQLSQRRPYHLIVSNPPYITAEEMKRLQPEILWYEDPQALDGGVDGLNLIRQIITSSANLLADGGHVWLEVAPQHPSSIQKIVDREESHNKLTLVETVKDTFGKKDRGTRDHIFNLRNIYEKCREFNVDLYTCFIDYTKAFDTVKHHNLWRIMKEMGFPLHKVHLIETLYQDQQAAVRANIRLVW